MKRNETHSKRLNKTLTPGQRSARNLRTAWALIAAAGCVGLHTHTAEATNDAWSTNPASSYFSNAGGNDWTTGTTTPGAANGTAGLTDSLYFGTSTTTALDNDDTGAAFTGLTFNSGASVFTISGNSFTLNGAITNNSSNTQTINTPITVSGTESINAATAPITFGGALSSGSVTLTGPQAVNLNGSGTALSAFTLGTPQTSDNGNSNASSPNIVGATATINANANIGTLYVNAGANVVNVAAGIAVTNTGIVYPNTSDRLTACNINLGAVSWTTNATNTNGVIAIGSQFNVLTLNGTDFAANSTNAAGGSLVAATYTNNTATVIGSATANPTLNTTVVTNSSLSANSYTNTLRFGSTTAYTLNLNTATLTVAGYNNSGSGGAILMSAASGAIVNTITGGNLTGSSNRGLAIDNYDTTSGSGLTINSNFNNFLISGGTINSTAIVGLNGGGTVTLGGSNLINGALAINNSTLVASSDANLGGTNGVISVTTATNSSTAVTLTSAAALTSGFADGDVLLGQVVSALSGTSVTLASAYTGTSVTSATNEGFAEGGAIDINGGTLEATSSFSLSEANSTGVVATRARAIGIGIQGGTIDVTALNTLTIPGVITGSTGSTPTFGALNKVDGGTLTIAGSASNGSLNLNNQAGTTVLANTTGTAVGTTTISGGTLLIGANGTANQTTNVFVNGGTLDLNGFGSIGSSFATINGTGGVITNSSTSANSVLYIGNGGGVYTDTLNIASVLTDGASKTLSLNIQGATTSTRNVDFTGASTFTGTTTVNSGTLTIDASTNPSASFAGSKTINIGSSGNASGTLHLLTVVGGSGSFTTNVSLLNSGATVTIVNSGANVPIVLDLNGNVQPIQSFVVGTTGEPAGYYGSNTFFSDNSGNPSITPANASTETLFSGDGGFVAAVPEPTVAGMLGVITGASLLHRRRKQR